MISRCFVSTRLGHWLLESRASGLCLISPVKSPSEDLLGDRRSRDIVKSAARSLEVYFSSGQLLGSIPICASVTQGESEFAQSIWAALAKVPRGATISYSDLGKLAGHPGSARAVGQVLGKNPLPVIRPCHRVICATGAIGGFRFGIGFKSQLLDWERSNKYNHLNKENRSGNFTSKW